MDLLKLISLIISNLGGAIAILNVIWTIYSARVKLDCKLTNVFANDDFNIVKLYILNRSSKSVSVYDICLAYTKSMNSGVFETSKDKIYITHKQYDDYSYPLFTDSLPITIPPNGSTSMLLEVFDNPNFDNVERVRISTDVKIVKTKLDKKLTKSVNLYQLR